MQYSDYNKAKSLENSINRITQLISHMQDILENGFKSKFSDVALALPSTPNYKHMVDSIRLEADDLSMLLLYQEEKLKKQQTEFKKLIIQ